jgi:1-acyl-sn-glycerol-3-phosphate acyltransferase
MRLMLDVDIQWHAPLPEGPKILAANHPTTTDPLYILTLLAEPVSVPITAASFHIINHIRNLARESEYRIERAQAAEAGTLPAPAWPVGVR